MDFFNLLTLANTMILAVYLIAGGWVSIRNYFEKREANQAAEAEAKAAEEAARIEAAVQARLAEVQSQTATSTVVAADPASTATVVASASE